MTEPSAGAWRCTVCGYVHYGPEPPDYCPVCGAGKADFEPFTEPAAADAADAPAVERWRCTVCGYVHEGPEPPDVCPLCGATRDLFEPEAGDPAGDAAGDGGGRIVIVGGGIAGLSAAEAVRQASGEADIVLVSMEGELPYYRLNLTRYLAGEVTDGDLPIHPEEWYADQRIELRRHSEVADISLEDRAITVNDGDRLAYDRLVITAGSHPFVPPIRGTGLEGVTSLRTATDARRIRDAAGDGAPCVCIGGGILGLETAGALARLGAEICLLESHEWLMPRQLNRRAGELLAAHAEKAGIRLIHRARTTAISGEGRAAAVELEDGTSIPAALVVVTTGVRPNTHLARSAGLEVNQGIVVDNRLRTSHPDVFAAGDVAEHRGTLYGIWNASQYQGQIAGMNAAGRQAEFGGIPRSNTLKVLGTDMFSIGRVEPEDGSFRVIEEERDGGYCRFLFRDNRLVGSVLLGDTTATGGVKHAIEERRDLSGLLRTHPSGTDVIDHLSGRSG